MIRSVPDHGTNSSWAMGISESRTRNSDNLLTTAELARSTVRVSRPGATLARWHRPPAPSRSRHRACPAKSPPSPAGGYDDFIWPHHDGVVMARCGPVSGGTEKKGLVRAGATSSRHATPDDQCGATSRRPSGANSSRPSQRVRPRRRTDAIAGLCTTERGGQRTIRFPPFRAQGPMAHGHGCGPRVPVSHQSRPGA
jgi:hypothetical protein